MAARFDRIAGTVRSREKAAAIAAAGIGGHKVETFVFDGSTAAPEVVAAVTDASAMLVSVPPGRTAIRCWRISPRRSRPRRTCR